MVDEVSRKIRDGYKEAILSEGKAPKTVFVFCKGLGIPEREFFDRFADFAALDAAIWAEWVSEAVSALDRDNDVGAYTARERYLAFLFTFVEVMKDNRSWLLARFPGVGTALQCRSFKRFREAFAGFADTLEIRLPVEEVTGRFAPSNWRSKVLYPHLLSLMEFFKDDGSDRFEATDAYVEKSVRVAFEVLEGGVFDAGVDLLRFLAGRNRR